ncbi:MAG: FtsW/RodA/SpoVE family cell cycle protein [Gemella sp.]|nr:FtsW/RodA/SpoVE family cell cycle protein [Gemella sp.]
MKTFLTDRGNIILLSFYFLLVFTSITSIFLAEYSNGANPTLFIKQILFFIVSLGLIYLIQKIDIFTLEKFSIVLFLFSIAALLLLLVMPESIAPTTNGAKAWFNFGLFTVQPSEFAKISTVAAVSLLLKQEHFHKLPDIVKLLELGLIIAIPFFLIAKENDLGNALFFIFLFLLLAFIVSSKNKTFLRIYVIILFAIGLIIAAAMYFPKLLNIIGFKNYQSNRILSWIYPESFRLDFSYQSNLVLKEISKGSLTGTFSENTHFVPELYNDFIFTVIAKSFGFMGSFLFIALYLVFLLYILRIAKKCQHGNFSYYFTILAVFTLAFPFIINTYSTTAMIPVIGISLPFISYGGSSLVANSILFAIILKINNTIYYEQLADTEEYEEDFEENEYAASFEDDTNYEEPLIQDTYQELHNNNKHKNI